MSLMLDACDEVPEDLTSLQLLLDSPDAEDLLADAVQERPDIVLRAIRELMDMARQLETAKEQVRHLADRFIHGSVQALEGGDLDSPSSWIFTRDHWQYDRDEAVKALNRIGDTEYADDLIADYLEECADDDDDDDDELVTCENCKGRGRVTAKHEGIVRVYLCPHCDGDGWVHADEPYSTFDVGDIVTAKDVDYTGEVIDLMPETPFIRVRWDKWEIESYTSPERFDKLILVMRGEEQ